MNILFVSNLFPPHVRGGYELGCRDIAIACQEMGHQVRVATSLALGQLKRSRSVSNLEVSYCFGPVYLYEEPVTSWLSGDTGWAKHRAAAFGGGIVSNMVTLYRHLQEHQPDLVWVFNPLGLGTVGLLEVCALAAKRCLVHLMDDIDGVVADYQQFQHYCGRLRRIKQRINAISCTEHIRSRNSQIGSYRRHVVIYNGVRFENFRTKSGGGARSATNLRFVYFGQVERHKGVMQLVRGAARLKHVEPECDFQIDIIGRGDAGFRTELEEAIGQLGLAGKVRLLGFVEKEELQKRLQAYDAAVLLLDKSEPFAYAPVEAAAAGLPVIITQIPLVKEAGELKDYPLLVKNRDDADEVASMLHFCARNRNELYRLGVNLRERWKSRFDFHQAVLPAYLKEIEMCQENRETAPPVETLVAPYQTYALYSRVVA